MRKIVMFAGILMVSLCASSAFAAVQGKEVDYSAQGVTLKGYLAYDDAVQGKRPGILVVHEWWGHNEYARKRARMLAELGYTALAVDMYGDGKQASHPDDAGKFAGEVSQNIPVARARFLAALNFLKSDPTVAADKIAAIGYCFGGGVVLNMARMGVDLKGVVSFHGSLGAANPAWPGAGKTRILVCHGAADQFVTPQQIDDFKKEMESAGVDYKFIAYEGAMHAFTNPDADRYAREFGLPLAYHQQADQRSWSDMRTFFIRIFQ
ncbi:MAG: dienelactone hydrolase family protein [Candidatus Omnitrophica bacterium]|nr:dienelactone hydrolase family protein [Candidatus Omnitrophota bacterium]